MTILVDLSQLTFSAIFAHLGNGTEVNEELLRHIILNVIRANRMKFKDEFGEIVLCCDSMHYWRKDFFPYYKASRKKNREESQLNWNSIFESVNKIVEELKENFPYKVIHIDGAEADDIIAHLALFFSISTEPTLILSGDHDFSQLHNISGIKQYAPIHKKWILCYDPVMYLREHIIIGDKGDGIPNIASPDNCIIIGERQKPLAKKKIAEWIKYDDPASFCNEYQLRNYYRNKTLIDFNCIPSSLRDSITQEFRTYIPKERKNLLNYFMKYKMKNLINSIGDF